MGQAPPTTPWVPLTTGTTQPLRAVTATPSGHLWASGYNTTLLASIDGGDTWVPQTSNPSTDNLRDLYAVDDNVVWGTGWHGTLNMAWGMDLIAPGSLWVVGSNGYVAHTSDGGTVWDVQSLPIPTANLYRIDAWDSQTAYATGEIGHVFRTTDGGLNWENVSVAATNERLDGLRVFSSSHVVVVGDAGVIYETVDAGQSWQPRVSGTTQDLRALWGPDPVSMVAVGQGGVAVRSPVVDVADYDDAVGHDFSPTGDEFFGACLREVLGDAQTDASTWVANATCPKSDGAWWHGIPVNALDLSSIVAKTAGPTAAGGADVRLRFGLRANKSASPGSYRTRIVFEVAGP